MNQEKVAKVVDRYEAGGRALVYACSGLTPEQAGRPIGPGAWSILQLAVHLLDADLIFGGRMKRVLAEDEPTLQSFDEDRWIERMPAVDLPLDEAVRLFADHRRWTARLLRRRPESDFARAGHNTASGRQSVATILAYAIAHVDHHLRFLYGKRGALGTFIDPRYTPEP